MLRVTCYVFVYYLGYKGFYDPAYPPMELNPSIVENIHHGGGTVLASSRGGFDLDKILDFLQSYKISQLYVIGGDGTHRGAFRIHEECMARVSFCFIIFIYILLCMLILFQWNDIK